MTLHKYDAFYFDPLPNSPLRFPSFIPILRPGHRVHVAGLECRPRQAEGADVGGRICDGERDKVLGETGQHRVAHRRVSVVLLPHCVRIAS
jgi:hypothetical protein